MRQVKKVGTLLLVLVLMGILCWGFLQEQSPEAIAWEKGRSVEGSWSLETGAVVFSCPMSQGDDTMLLQSHWTQYALSVDGREVYTAAPRANGAVHLFSLPQGKTLTLRFSCEDPAAAASIAKSQIFLGTKGGIYRMLVRENLYAVLFAALAALVGLICVCGGWVMGSGSLKNLSGSTVNLGLYVLATGLWVLTDSKILLLVTQKTGFVEFVSFLAFYFFPIPMLGFTKSLFGEQKKLFKVLQTLFGAMLVLFVGNYLLKLSLTSQLIIAEHVLMAGTIVTMLTCGIRKLRKKNTRTLRRIMMGYGVFALFSGAALVFYYLNWDRMYSISYILGILGFIIFLGDTAWIELYEQIQENANVAMYARMAYKDMMTGIGNRAAFMKRRQEDVSGSGSLAYVMLDVNGLKTINDSMGHQKGDELIVRVSECIQKAVGTQGSCFRIGGDEFVIAFRDQSREAVLGCAEAIRAELRAANAGSTFPISAALGCAWSDGEPRDPEALLREADDAMYTEKKQMKGSREHK